MYGIRYNIYGEYDNNKLLYVKIYYNSYDLCELKLRTEIFLDTNNTYTVLI